MFRKLFASTMILAALSMAAVPAYGLIAMPPPGPTRIVHSDAVFVGKVTAIEPMDVEAKAFPGAKEPTKYRIAIVEIKEVIKGVKGEKTIRVGFIPLVAPKVGAPIVSSGGRSPQLTVGQEGLFMINKQQEGKFYQAPGFGYFVAAAQKNFNDEVKTAKNVVAVMANPVKALESKNADDQLMAASTLVMMYRSNRTGRAAQQEPIDAKESKLILNAIANGKWQQAKFGQMGPWQVFLQLGLTKADGWNAQNLRTVDEQRTAVQTWVREHGDTYRIKRFVAASDK